MASIARTMLVLVLLAAATAQVHAGDERSPDLQWRWANFSGVCGGQCGVAVYGGWLTSTNMVDIFGISDVTAPWDWKYRDSKILAVAFSRRVASWGALMDFEVEAGVAKRFGIMDETEVWAAFFARWIAFPWNRYLYTTFAVSTGLNWASDISDYEKKRSGNKQGSQLLHFLSPEITFALPDQRHIELLLRFHHRSGGRDFFGDIELFNGVSGAAHYATVGLRYRF